MMKTYIGTKIVNAEPMTRNVFEETQKKRSAGVTIQLGDDLPGYKVEYEDGYVSWSPKEVFERCYREVTDNEAELVARGV